MPSDLHVWVAFDLHVRTAVWRMLHACGALRLAARRRDPLAGAVMWAHDAQVHMLVFPAQTANSEDRVLTSCGTPVLLRTRWRQPALCKPRDSDQAFLGVYGHGHSGTSSRPTVGFSTSPEVKYHAVAPSARRTHPPILVKASLKPPGLARLAIPSNT
jgi:hypothetical protein